MTTSSKILIVEDNQVQLRATQAALEKSLGNTIRCIKAHSCEQMREAITHHSIDLVILDLHLPDATGLEALEQLKELNDDIPVIILTGGGGDEVRLRALARGVGAYLEKTPTGMMDLPMIAVGMLESKRHERRYFAAIRQQLQSVNNVLEELRRDATGRLEYLELVVVGTADNPGLVKKEEENTRFRKRIQKIYWVFIGGVISTIASSTAAIILSRVFHL